MTSGGYIHMLPYNRGAEMHLPDSMQNLQPVIDANHLYILMSSQGMLSGAQAAVQGMLLGELDVREAYERMSAAAGEPERDRETAAVLEAGYSVTFRQGVGSEAASAIANTLRQAGGSELLLAPSSICPGSLYAGEYTGQRLEESIQSGGNRLYTAELTGAEIREIVRLAVEGYGSLNDPFSAQTLPVSSGFTMEVERTQEGYRLSGLLKDGAPLAEDAVYTFTIADVPPQFQSLAERALGSGGENRFSVSEQYARTIWTDCLREGGQPAPPTAYIVLKEPKGQERG